MNSSPAQGRSAQGGFTLLEVLIATVILGVAIVGLLGNMATSVQNAARLTDYDRVVLLGKRQMDAMLMDPRLPLGAPLQGQFDPTLTGGNDAGWTARLSIFEAPPSPGPGVLVLERLQFEVWWGPPERRRTVPLEGFRSARLTPEGMGVLP